MTLAANGIEVRYAGRPAVRPTSLELRRGELVALVGPNGAGKSTLLKALGGLIPHGGEVTWNGRRLLDRDRARTLAAERAVDGLSVGERARVLLARALAVEAPALLVDEPIAMQDPHHQLRVMATLRDYARPDRIVIAVLHDLGLAARFCSRVLLMESGALVADGPPAAALSADSIRAHYRVEPFMAVHDDEAVIVPWRALAD
jgi:iron complex transport system ATP-binding protein